MCTSLRARREPNTFRSRKMGNEGVLGAKLHTVTLQPCEGVWVPFCGESSSNGMIVSVAWLC